MKIPDNRLPTLIVLAFSIWPAIDAASSPLERSARRRMSRALSYPQDSLLGLFFALALPIDDPLSSKAVNVAFFFEANYKLGSEEEEDDDEQAARRRRRAIDRTTLYRVIKSKFDSLGLPGRQCLLRSICETARDLRPEHRHNGLIGDLMRITFTASTSEAEEDADYPEYLAAEDASRSADCGTIYQSCPFSIYQHITEQLLD